MAYSGVRRPAPVVATLEELDEEALIQILTEPKNALIKQYQKLFAWKGRSRMRPQALQAIAKKAWRGKPGPGPALHTRTSAADIMFDLPTMENVSKSWWTRTPSWRRQALLIYAEPPKVRARLSDDGCPRARNSLKRAFRPTMQS